MAKKKDTVTTNQLIEKVVSEFEQLPKKVTKDIIDAFLGEVEEILAKGGKLKIDRLGIFEVKDRAARTGRNPATGEEIKIPASKKVAFRVSKSLKDKVAST